MSFSTSSAGMLALYLGVLDALSVSLLALRAYAPSLFPGASGEDFIVGFEFFHSFLRLYY
jgi:hypothetical protein